MTPSQDIDTRPADWNGRGQNSIYSTLGASNHSNYKRAEHDYYATNPIAMQKLLDVHDFSKRVWEPACGQGHLSKILIENDKIVLSTDLIDRGFGAVEDFLTTKRQWGGDIITNPPYKYAQQFVEKAMSILSPDKQLALFLKLTFLEGAKRREMFKECPPEYIYVFSRRVNCALNGDEKMFSASSAACYAWFIWRKGFNGEPIIRWI